MSNKCKLDGALQGVKLQNAQRGPKDAIVGSSA